MSETRRFRVLFVCIGNSCRSPMAEAIARSKYPDLMEVSSAGVGPAPIIQPQTYQCLAEKGFELPSGKEPERLDKTDWRSMDVIVNISGMGILPMIPDFQGGTLIWEVADPMGQPIGAYREARDQLEGRLDRLAAMLRSAAQERA